MLTVDPIELVPVSGQWRVLTKKVINQHIDPEASLAEALHALVTSVASVLVICNADMNSEEVAVALQQEFGGKLEEILQLVSKLHASISQVASQDFVFHSCTTGEPFESERMVDAHGGPQRGHNTHDEPEGHVLCTTEMGLTAEKHGLSTGGEEMAEIIPLLQPHILLSTSLEMEDEEEQG
jgi:hypothetical protein